MPPLPPRRPSQLASEPVVTLCGHLYCWPCLYRWLQVQSHCRTCPVCKAGVEKDKVRAGVCPASARSQPWRPRYQQLRAVLLTWSAYAKRC